MLAGMVLRSTGRGNAAAARAVDEPQPVDQHQRALGAEVAQVDFRRTCADAAAVRRVAEIAAVVDLGVQAAGALGRRCRTSATADRPVLPIASWSSRTTGES